MIVVYVQASHNTNKALLYGVETIAMEMIVAEMIVAEIIIAEMIVAELNIFQHRGRGYWLLLHLAQEGFRG